MPKKKKEIDYSKTVIYKIQCKDPAIKETYGGHSVNLRKRTGRHKSDCDNINAQNYNCYLYQFIRANGGWNNWEVVWMYNFPCANLEEATIEEQRFIEEYDCELNMVKAHTTKEETKERARKNAAKRRANETEEEKAKRLKQNNDRTKNKIKNETEEEKAARLEKAREKEANRRANETEEKKERRKKKRKERYKLQKANETEEEKAARLEKGREKIKCEICNVEISRKSMTYHKTSKTHLKKLEEYNKNQAIKQLDEELAEQLL